MKKTKVVRTPEAGSSGVVGPFIVCRGQRRRPRVDAVSGSTTQGRHRGFCTANFDANNAQKVRQELGAHCGCQLSTNPPRVNAT